MNSCEDFWQCITPDAWITSIGTLLGAFLGAFLAGIFTIISVKRTLNHDSLQRKMSEITNHLKISTDFISKINPIAEKGNELKELILNDDSKKGTFQNKTIEIAEGLCISLKLCNKELNTLNLNSISYDYYGHYMITKTTIEVLEDVVNLLLVDLKRPIKTDYIHFSANYDNFVELLGDLNNEIKTLKDIREKSESERNDIKKKI